LVPASVPVQRLEEGGVSVCQGGIDPYNCPPVMCVGCPRVVIHSEGKAQLCPVCSGSGRVYVGHDAMTTAVMDNTKVCHGCGGKGWVTV
jgi:hypothetical protein